MEKQSNLYSKKQKGVWKISSITENQSPTNRQAKKEQIFARNAKFSKGVRVHAQCRLDARMKNYRPEVVVPALSGCIHTRGRTSLSD